MKRSRPFVLMLALILLLALPAQAAGLPTPDVELTAQSAVIVNLDLGQTVYTKNENTVRSIASLTKMMTALVAYDLSGGQLKETNVTVPVNIWGFFEGYSNISVSGLVPGETLTLYDMLHALLIPSGNEAATSIALHFGYNEFIDAMNSKAAELGMKSTRFVNPHGLDAEGHVSTAHDIALLAQALYQNTALYEITQKTAYQLPATDRAEARTIYTTNLAMLSGSSSYYAPLRGIKTGYTKSAGHCLASTASYGGDRYLIVLMGCEYGSVFAETAALYRWCFLNLSVLSPIDGNTVAAQVKVTGSAQKDTLVLYPDRELYTLFAKGEQPEVTYRCELPESVPAPVAPGDIIGTAEVFYDGRSAGTINLVAREAIEKSIFIVAADMLGRLLTSTPAIIVMGLLFLFFIAYLYYIKVVIPRMEKRRKKQREQQKKQSRR